MTKEEFVKFFNIVIRKFNENHDVELGIVIVIRATHVAEVLSNFCPFHGLAATAALSSRMAGEAHEVVEALKSAPEASAEKLAEDFLRNASLEKGN